MKTIIMTLAMLAAASLGAAEGGHDHDHGEAKPKPKVEQPMDGDAKPKPYPKDTCIVSGEKLGSMGKPIVMVHQGQEVKFCCKSCIKDFKQDPDTYIAKLKDQPGDKAEGDKAEGDKPAKPHDHGDHGHKH